MPQLNHKELEKLWVEAGGNPGSKNLMAAIAEAESGGKSWEVNYLGATGLWQIHPGGNQYLDPLTNAVEAVQKFNTQGLGAWETYTKNEYQKFLVGTENVQGPGGSPSHAKLITKGAHKGERIENPEGAEQGAEGGFFSTATPLPEIEELWKKSPFDALLKFFGTSPKEAVIRILEIVGGGLLLLIAIKELFNVHLPETTPIPVPVP